MQENAENQDEDEGEGERQVEQVDREHTPSDEEEVNEREARLSQLQF